MNGGAAAARDAAPAARIAASVLLGACLVLFAAIGVSWLRDRARDWEEPRWNPARFTRIDRAPTRAAARAPDAELWVVVVNPDCGHCAQSLHDAALVRGRRSDDPSLRALIVDQARRPPHDVFRVPGVESVWWDEHAVWRKSWGHRVYGEVLRFDAGGRFLETWSPERVARDVPDP